jgi:hypothetical protein
MKILDQIKANAVPLELMRTAAKGGLPLPAAEMLEILVYLTQHPVCADDARMTLARWDAASAMEIVADPGAPPEVLGYFWLENNRRSALMAPLIENPSIPEMLLVEAAGCDDPRIVSLLLDSPRARKSPIVMEALAANPALTPEQARQLQSDSGTPEPDVPQDAETEAAHRAWHEAHAAEIAAEEGKPFELTGEGEDHDAAADASHNVPASEIAPPVDKSTALAAAGLAKAKSLPTGEMELSALHKVMRMNAAERVKAAFSGSKEERLILIRDGARVVQFAVLASPKLTEPEVEVFASAKNVSEAVLREIGRSRRFLKNYHVVRNLVNNPKCPLDVALTLVKNLLVFDLKNLRFNKGVPETIRQVAGQLYREKTGPAKDGRR